MTLYPPSHTPYSPPPPGSPIRDFERLWLLTCCTYEQFDEETMLDAYWDKFALELWQRREEWSPYFRWALPSADFNVSTTGSGVDWSKNTAARPVYEACVQFYGRDPLGIIQ